MLTYIGNTSAVIRNQYSALFRDKSNKLCTLSFIVQLPGIEPHFLYSALNNSHFVLIRNHKQTKRLLFVLHTLQPFQSAHKISIMLPYVQERNTCSGSNCRAWRWQLWNNQTHAHTHAVRLTANLYPWTTRRQKRVWPCSLSTTRSTNMNVLKIQIVGTLHLRIHCSARRQTTVASFSSLSSNDPINAPPCH